MNLTGMKKALLISLFALPLASMAQQDPMFTQYMFNPLSINPAYAGSADMFSAAVIYRNQWVNFDGAPITQTFTMHTPLKRESISVGLSAINDSHGPVDQTGFYADVSYRLFLDKSKLAFGLKGGLNLFSADLLSLNPLEDNDVVFASNISSELLPNFGFGIMWYSKRYYLGVSAPKLLENELLSGDIPSFNNNTESRHMFLIAGMVFDINHYVKFKPSIMLRAVEGAPLSGDITANFLFYDRFWAGAMYRHQDAVGALFQYEIKRTFRVGYSYDYTLSEIANYSNGTHEIMIGLDLGRKPEADLSPRYF